MKINSFSFFPIFLIFLIFQNHPLTGQTENKLFDKTLADSLGADERGMKTYFFVILKTGSTKTDDKEKISTIFKGHLENIAQLVKVRKLIVAGPFGKNDREYRGLYIFNLKTREELDALLITDPAIKEGFLEPEVFEWYGSAALPMYLESAEKISRIGL